VRRCNGGAYRATTRRKIHGRSVTANALNDFLRDYGEDLCVDGSGSIVVRPLCVRFLCEQSFLLEATFPSFAFSAFSR